MTKLLLLIGVVASSAVSAHPLGNNTFNREATLAVAAQAVTLDYRIDLAEIPTLVAAAQADRDADGETSAAEWNAYAQRTAAEILAGVDLRLGGVALSPGLVASSARLLPGEAGLQIVHLDVRLVAPLPANARTTTQAVALVYRDQRKPDEIGWKDVIVTAGEGVRLVASNAPAASLSAGMTAYPDGDRANRVDASVEVAFAAAPVSAAATPATNAASTPGQIATATSQGLTPRVDGQMDATPAAVAPNTTPTVASPGIAPTVQAASTTVSTSPPALSSWAFFKLGVHHIAIGVDHLVFLLGLVVAHRHWRRLIGIVTAFTVAHSLTLGLAAAGLVTLPGAWVEAAIALTIAWVGFATLIGKFRHGIALTFVFGLIHGFGFAGALADTLSTSQNAGIASGSGWLWNLAAFNLGIEAFQLLLVAIALPILAWITRQRWHENFYRVVSFGVMSAGLVWFASRV